MYGGSRIKLYYLPYINQLGIQSGLDMLNKEHKREAENLLRDRIGVPRVGEGWVSETELYRTIRAIFPGRRIEREASPDFLGKQRFDIYFPDEGVAVEYQGEQHAGPVGRFGGRSGHERAVERDQSKREKAEKAGVQLVEFWYYEKITEEKVRKRLGKFLGDE
ncbi:hypothetical protein CKO15_09000 [Halorhodospira abdelmalekii]|nr:hypothetical protein [Halorhodospira abdelmalekii]